MASPVASADDISSLREFHRVHFPNQATPEIQLPTPIKKEQDDGDDLGYYDDGVKRTLTDDQIKMFRHSEVQRLLQQRRHKAQGHDAEVEDLRRPLEQGDITTPPRRQHGHQHHKGGNFRFYDEPSSAATNAVLDYEEEGSVSDQPISGTFIWPKLGS